jgi:hypothetical protein
MKRFDNRSADDGITTERKIFWLFFCNEWNFNVLVFGGQGPLTENTYSRGGSLPPVIYGNTRQNSTPESSHGEGFLLPERRFRRTIKMNDG